MDIEFGLTLITGLDYSQRNPKNIKPGELLGMYYYRDDGVELTNGRLYITRRQLPPHNVIQHKQLLTSRISPTCLTIVLDDSNCIVNAGIFR